MFSGRFLSTTTSVKNPVSNTVKVAKSLLKEIPELKTLKKPVSAYLAYSMTQPVNTGSITERAKQASSSWKALGDAEKEVGELDLLYARDD